MDEFETVELISSEEVGLLWRPIVKAETYALLENLSNLAQKSKNQLRDQSLSILAKCANPTKLGDRQIGLAIGYVQSGKTMSFTTVAALARDNGYRIVVVIAGTSQHLFKQSVARLERDLRLRARSDHQWLMLTNPRANSAKTFEDTLADWKDENVPSDQRRTILVVVMKYYTHLQNLLDLLSSLDLVDVPALVIDDEADQAGMNTLVNQGEESSTYQKLILLRNSLPNHSYLQYTATPQAPLLINIIDALSPNFAEILTPGDGYVGGLTLFEENRNLIRQIPGRDVPGRRNRPVAPPDSLTDALKLFFLGVAAGYELGCKDGNRSMMVHPSQSTDFHEIYHRWVIEIRDDWRRTFDLPLIDFDRTELVADFRAAYDDLANTVMDLPSHDRVFARLPQALRNTKIELVNSTEEATDKIDWREAYPFILVGGKAMDRGFTVEGLTVTYMPRSPGIGNADTVQQRARFFGYKRSYLGYCRVFLEGSTIAAFEGYVEHEEDIRRQLSTHGKRSLDEWKRAFFLSPNLRPTRHNVLNFDYVRGDFSLKWFYPRAPHESLEHIAENRNVIREFLTGIQTVPDTGHDLRTEDQIHQYSKLTLDKVYSELLVKLKNAAMRDSQQYTGLLLQIRSILDDEPDAVCDLYSMVGGKARQRKSTEGELGSFFQGSYSIGNTLVYPGDAEVRSRENVTVQIHNFNIREGTSTWTNVFTIAVRLPVDHSRSWISQQQGVEEDG